MSSGGGKTQKVQTVQNSSPWAPTVPGLTKGIEDLGKQYDSGAFLRANQPYMGQRVAGLAPETTQSWDNIANMAGDNSTVQNAINYNNSMLSGDLSTGFLGNLTSDITDQVNASMSSMGRYGSGTHQNALSRGITSAVLPYASQAASLAPTLDRARYQGQEMLGNVGQSRQNYGQTLINDAITQEQALKNAPISAITDYMQALSGNWGGSTTGTQPSQAPQTSPWMQGAGLGLGFLGSMLGGF